MRRRSRATRPPRDNRSAQLVAIVVMGIVLFIVIKFRTTLADNVSAVFGAVGGAETSDLKTDETGSESPETPGIAPGTNGSKDEGSAAP